MHTQPADGSTSADAVGGDNSRSRSSDASDSSRTAAAAVQVAVYEVTVVPVLRAAHLPRKARKGTLRGTEYTSKA